MKKIRLGVVGLGHRGRFMFRTSAICFDFIEPVAACDLNPRNFYEKQWLMQDAMSNMLPNCTYYKDYDEMLEKANLDVILVETGADVHADFICKAMKKNINVLTDIPLVANLKEADRLWKLSKTSKSTVSVGANPNEQKFSLMLQDYYKQGKLGKPYYMECEYLHYTAPGSEEAVHLNENGDWRRLLCPIRYCTHSLGPLLTILKEDLRYVSCFGTGIHANDVNEYYKKYKKDDMQSALLRTESGVTVRLLRNGRMRALMFSHSYRVFGTEGYMERSSYEHGFKSVIRYNSVIDSDEQMHEVDGSFMPPEYENDERLKRVDGGHVDIDFAILDHYYKAILSGSPAPIPIKEGLRMTIPGIYCEESAKRGGELMKIKYPWDEDWSTKFDK